MSTHIELLWTGPAREVVLRRGPHPRAFASPFGGAPFALLVIAAHELPASERAHLALAAIEAGCRYASTWGAGCTDWHEDFDEAYLASCPDHEPTDDTLVMTTTHDRDLLPDALFFHLFCTDFHALKFQHYLIWLPDDAGPLAHEIARTVRRLLSS